MLKEISTMEGSAGPMSENALGALRTFLAQHIPSPSDTVSLMKVLFIIIYALH
jgi:hypothetical protein